MPFYERRSDPVRAEDLSQDTLQGISTKVSQHGVRVELVAETGVRLVSGPFANLSDQILAQEALYEVLDARSDES